MRQAALNARAEGPGRPDDINPVVRWAVSLSLVLLLLIWLFGGMVAAVITGQKVRMESGRYYLEQTIQRSLGLTRSR